MPCEDCCEPDNYGDYDPCCNKGDFRCEFDISIQMCIHCGASGFEENGFWFHHSQEYIPFEDRRIQYTAPK